MRKNLNTFVLPIIFLALVCIFALAQTNIGSKEEKQTDIKQNYYR